MFKESILKNKTKILSEDQRNEYFDNGGITIEKVLDNEWLNKAKESVEVFVNNSKKLSQSNEIYDLEKNHTFENPKLRRVSSPRDYSKNLWDLLSQGPIGDTAEDLLGPIVKWHQDKPFFPHSNDSVITIGVYLEDCDDAQGPLEIISGSHKERVFSHYNNSLWAGDINQNDIKKINLNKSKVLKGRAGSVTVHNYRTIHGSKPNNSKTARPLMLYVLSSGDSVPFTPQPLKSKYEQVIVRGNYNNRIHCEPGEFLIPPNWNNGYSSIFAIQQKEDK